MSLDNINYIELREVVEGRERVRDIMKMPLNNSTLIPNTVTYKDIDSAVKEWLNDMIRMVGDDGRAFPTMTLFSNQRFSEYAQSWLYTDENKNLLLNFKTITRENNPQYGSIQNRYYNIPGEKYYTLTKIRVLDDNGSESLRVIKMRQPLSVDIIYKISIFTNKYESLNEFNTKINRLFSSRQTYINANGYYMSMILESINDESEYKIDDRQFYSQSANVKVLGFLITEDDFRVEEVPLKFSVNIDGFKKKIKKPEAEIEECDYENPYYYKPIELTLTYPICKTNKCDFKIDIDFVCTEMILKENVNNNFKVLVNGEEINKVTPFSFKENDEISVIIKKKILDKNSILIFKGYDPNEVYDKCLDNPEVEIDNTQKTGQLLHPKGRSLCKG